MSRNRGDLELETLETRPATPAQQIGAGVVCAAFAVLTAALLPSVGGAIPATPGFIAINQSLLIAVYALTTYLLFAQFGRARSASLLALSAGNLYTTLVVFVQLLTFPGVLTAGRLLGASPATTTWLWSFWHIGPPLYGLAYAILVHRERRAARSAMPASKAHLLGWMASGLTILVVIAATFASISLLDVLPKQVEADATYWPVTTSGVGPVIGALNVLALVVLWRVTRLRTVLQVWLAVSLFVLLLDNMLTLPASARDTVGWFAGRLEALVAGLILLAVFLREVEVLYARAERSATDRERERAALQVARDNLALALDAAGMGDWDLDLTTDRSRRTLQHDRIFGYDRLLPRWGRSELMEHVVPEDRPVARKAFADALATGGLDLVCRIRPATGGSLRWIALRGKATFDADGQATSLSGVIMDTTTRHAFEERMNQAQKMDAIGQLTGGVAHDFNNLLTVIIGNLDMIARKPDNVGRVQRLAQSGLLAAKRGAEVTEKLLTFSRRQAVRPETVNPNRMIQEFLPLLQRAVGETIAVDVDLDPALDPVRFDPGQFEAALLNLAVNAKDAMPGGGTLRVSSRVVTLTEDVARELPDLAAGRYVCVSVADTGQGMDEATRARAFEPFFTTKDVGKGTGLGLSQVYGFAKQANGHVRIQSSPSSGTKVEIYLPPSAERSMTAPGPASHGGTAGLLRPAIEGEVVLVVEDEPAVLEMAVESLTELGYVTLTACNAHVALDRLRGADRIDILFSDVVMPGGMNGVQLTVEARRIRPGLKVLLASGYTASALGSEHAMPDDVLLLKKPYMREELAATLKIVLHG